MNDSSEATVRLDKWLHAARIFKTRSLATQAVTGGKVQLNDERVKPARAVKPGDRLHITRERDALELMVLGLATRRGPAALARQLYQETEASVAARDMRRAEQISRPRPEGRPDKRQRREWRRTTGRD